ncbi:MAG: glucuronate isomerase [Acidothermaceae bacterium]
MPLHPDRLFPADPTTRAVARELYEQVRGLPLICPHGHVAASLLAENAQLPDPVALLVAPDHYLTRMLNSQGIEPSAVGAPRRDGVPVAEPRDAWRTFCAHWYLFRGTPSRLWLEQALEGVFGVRSDLGPDTADEVFDAISEKLATPQFRPRALFDSFNIEILATTDSPLDTLESHARLADEGYRGRVVPTFRPDDVIDPDRPGWADNVERLGKVAGQQISNYADYLTALKIRRSAFRAAGATATDHGHPTAATADLDQAEASRLFDRLRAGRAEPGDAELFRAQMLTESAAMSVDDGLVMQLHPGSVRDHVRPLFERYGRDAGGDIPAATEYVQALRPMLDRFGSEPKFRLVLFTLDESAYSRELAPLAGVYPAVFLGPPWWFFDSAEGIRRFRELTTETAGLYNTVGFNDDTRALASIPVRHDVARRLDCAFLAQLVAEHRLPIDEAQATAADLAYHLPRRGYRLDDEAHDRAARGAVA